MVSNLCVIQKQGELTVPLFKYWTIIPFNTYFLSFKEKHYIGTTHSKKNGKFFQVHIKLDHSFETHVCKGQLTISCIVGNSDVEVHSQYFHTCPGKENELYVLNLTKTK